MVGVASKPLSFGRIIQNVLLVLGLVAFPLMVAVLSSAYAEAFHGDTMPLIETIMGLLVGAVLAMCILGLVFALRSSQRHVAAAVVIVLLVGFDVAAIPVAGWLLRTAYASPTNVIEWW